MPTALPTQISGAVFLGQRSVALLADQPRCGKTAAALLAADYIFAASILVVTTASGKPVWRRAIKEWCLPGRSTDDVVVVGWPDLQSPTKRAALLRRRWAVLILDEAHARKSFTAKRTQAVFGVPELDGQILLSHGALVKQADVTWLLTGTPLPNSPADAYPMLRALCPERLTQAHGEFDVTCYADFMKRYCVTRPKKIGNWRWIDVVVGGRNLPELGKRLDGFMLRRTQEDVGIHPPIYDLLPLEVSAQTRRKAEQGLDTKAILAAAEAGDTKALEMHMGPLRRLTGEIKAHAVVEAVKEEFEGGLDKLVLFAWHRDTMDLLEQGLTQFGVVRLDGSTSPTERASAEDRFRGKARVFIGQIIAAGEAIDLSASGETWFVESSWIPKDMHQASLRITNHNQARQAIVRVCVLEGSVDEALQAVLMRKWTSIREVLSNATH